MDSIQNKPETAHTNKPYTPPVPGPKPAPAPAPAALEDMSEDRIEQLLEGILGQLRDMQRGHAMEDFSVMRTLAGIVQVLACGALVFAIWKLTGPGATYEPVLTALGFATVLQVMALTFYTMRDKR